MARHFFFVALVLGLTLCLVVGQRSSRRNPGGTELPISRTDLEALKAELEYIIHENFLELEAKTDVFLQKEIKQKYEEKFQVTIEEMREQILNLTNELDSVNRRCSCLQGRTSGVDSGGAVPSNAAWEREIRRRNQHSCNNMAVTASNLTHHGGKVFNLCDQDGWLPFHRSFGSSDLFSGKNWGQYRDGFGEAAGNSEAEFWLGLESLSHITNSDGRYQLMIKMVYKSDETGGVHKGQTGWIVYDDFRIDTETKNFVIHIGPILNFERISRASEFDPIHDVTMFPERKMDGASFSTWDSDNDQTSANCADTYSNIGWWFNACYHICLTQNNPFWYDGEVLQYLDKVEMLVKDVGGTSPSRG